MPGVRTLDGRTLTIKKNGFHCLSVVDEYNNGGTIDRNHARELARAIENQVPATVSTREGDVLVFDGGYLGLRSKWHHGRTTTTPQSDPLSRMHPDVVNPQSAERAYGPWLLFSNHAVPSQTIDQRPRLAAALRAASEQ